MEFFEVLKSRSSCRNFDPTPLEDGQVEVLMDAVQRAPSAFNKQYSQFTFITDREALELINRSIWDHYEREGDTETLDRLRSRHESALYGAPLLVVISGPDNHYGALDSGIAAFDLALTATAMELGSCIVAANGIFMDGPLGEKVEKLLNLPTGHQFHLGVLIGKRLDSKEQHSFDGHQISRIL